MGRPVRPTKLCLDECLDTKLPPINTPLESMDHPWVKVAQTIPPSNGKRVQSLNDRIWLRARRSDARIIATELKSTEIDERGLPDSASWWMGYAGLRRDIYPELERRAARAALNTPAKVCTDFLLPREWDADRLLAEQELHAHILFRRWLLEGIVESMRDGHARECINERFCITVLVRADSGGEAYLAVGTVGFHVDVETLAIILNMIPGLSPSDWQPEPSKIAGIEPQPGQLVFSTLLPPEVQAMILNEVDPA